MGVDGEAARRAAKALAVLSDLTVAAARRDPPLSVDLEWFRWLDNGPGIVNSPPGLVPQSVGSSLLDRLAGEPIVAAEQPYVVQLDRRFATRLAAVQQVRTGRSALEVGWLWLAGTTVVDTGNGRTDRRAVFLPLVHRPVRVVRELGLAAHLVPQDDPRLTPLVGDRAVAMRLEEQIETGGGAFERFSDLTPTLLARLTRLRAFAASCAAAAGFPNAPLTIAREQPEELMRHDGVQIVVGLAVFAAEAAATRTTRLAGWPDDRLDRPTAFHAVYAGLVASPGEATSRIEAPLPLTSRQTAAVVASQEGPVTVVAGAPGTGKGHTLVCIVADALRRGESVLLTARSEAAVDALVELMGRQPGLTPVVFGSNQRRAALARGLADGELHPSDSAELAAAEAALRSAIAARDDARELASTALGTEWLRSPGGRDALVQAHRVAPGAFAAPAADLAALVVRCREDPSGWWARRRRRRAVLSLHRLAGAAAGTPFDEVVDSIRVAMHQTSAVPIDLTTPDGIRAAASTSTASALHDSEAAVRRALTAWLTLAVRSPDRLDRAGLGAVATLATALRSGRSARRAQLERLHDRTLVRALPVWIGTLGDVDDLLPAVPALFDLVLIDEASSTEQTLAAPTLLRGARAVVVGDPRQLRHVSFLGDDTISDALDRHRVDDADRAQLDVRRNSMFDAAAAVRPAIALDEHFRSAPHLIDVVARTLYGGRLHVATRTPVSESLDCVHLTAVDGVRDDGVVRAEIDAVLAAIRQHAGMHRSVGVVTPFRNQADALERSILARFDADELIAMNLRVGTVHSFQGNERDHVVCSLGLTSDDRGGWTFANDPHLLAVMLTRARRTMRLVTSCTVDDDSILGQYVAAADLPPGPPAPVAELGDWAGAIATDLRLAGIAVETAYPAGRHVVDIATVCGERPVAIICDLHPDGTHAHVERHLALVTQGWLPVNALRSEWGDDSSAVVLQLTALLRGTPP